jgi:CheY-like chemotaxis protein/anti-sigma regulatory factor (Ser/Thr protein kinase)
LGDAHHLRQVLINLLGNAVKYTDQGRISLRLTAIDGQIRFEVADTGLGIDPSEQQHIFQAFYQTEAGAALGEGAGLGLTISREFVRLMGGEIDVQSQPGRGSVFAFTLALPETSAAPKPVQHARVLGLKPEQPPVRILVAEDNADSRNLIIRLLGSVGFDVLGVDNGAQAVDGFKNWRPHFIWMDIRMPLMDGFEATRQIRALPGGEQVKIVALTASVFQERLGDILAAGCDDILSKPFEEEHLFRIMGDLLNLQYRYAEAEPEKANRDFDLSEVSEELRISIKRAADELDLDAFAGIIASLRPAHPATAAELECMVDEFRFEQIQRAADPEARFQGDEA